MEFNFISFVLGISVVLVAGGLAVGVIGFFKAIRLKKIVDANHKQIYTDFDKQNNFVWTQLEGNKNQARIEVQNLSQWSNQEITSIKKDIDSRFDKMDNKIKNIGGTPIKDSGGVSGKTGRADGNG